MRRTVFRIKKRKITSPVFLLICRYKFGFDGDRMTCYTKGGAAHTPIGKNGGLFMLQFSPNSTIALVGSSDRLPRGSDAVPRLCAFLESLGLRTVVFPSLYQTAAGTPQPAERRAADIQAAFASPEVDAVFDLTGGDGANVVLPHLDLRKIAHTPKPFFGYSDVSALLNPLQVSVTCRCSTASHAFWQAALPPQNGSHAGYSGRTMTCFAFAVPFYRAASSPEKSAAATSAAR